MVIRDVVLFEPVGDLVFVVFFDVAVQALGAEMPLVGATTLLPPLIQVRLASGRGGEALEYQEPGEAQSTLEASLKDGWVNTASIQLGPVNLRMVREVRIRSPTLE